MDRAASQADGRRVDRRARVDRSATPTSARTTDSDTEPSGRLSTTTSARRATSATSATNVGPVGAAVRAGDVVGDARRGPTPRGWRRARCPCCRARRSRRRSAITRRPPRSAADLGDAPASPRRRPARRSRRRPWNSSSSSSSSVTPARDRAPAWSRNSSIRPSAAVMASTSRLRSRVVSGPPRAQTPQALEVIWSWNSRIVSFGSVACAST